MGPPVPSNIIKLVDVEEKEYFARNGQGEVRCASVHSYLLGPLNNNLILEKNDKVLNSH